MKIVRIRAYQIDLPLVEGRYAWSGGNSVSVFDSTVVAVETDDDIGGAWDDDVDEGLVDDDDEDVDDDDDDLDDDGHTEDGGVTG